MVLLLRCVREWVLHESCGEGSCRAMVTYWTSKDTVMACFSPEDQWFVVSEVDNEVGQYSSLDGRLALQQYIFHERGIHATTRGRIT